MLALSLFEYGILATLLVFVLPPRLKYWFALLLVLFFSAITSTWAIQVLSGKEAFKEIIHLTFWLKVPRITVDKLSAFFILLINFTLTIGLLYGYNYLKAYREKNIVQFSLHFFSYTWLHLSMLFVVMLRDGLAFLTAWEIMAVSSFLLVVFEAEKPITLRAGINYFLQMHIGMLFVLGGFFLLAGHTGAADFDQLQRYFLTEPNLPLFLLFFVGFGVKAGMVPFHTWLPNTYPVSPAHIAGIMSGIVTKMGIYGILRVTLSLQHDLLDIGLLVLTVSLISTLFGIIMANAQGELKKMLAYSSVENIGIIGTGIGMGIIGLALNKPIISVPAFCGALFHLMNHSLFKSLLFYATGALFKRTQTTQIEELGGIVKQMPYTSVLFLLGTTAIAGLPPLNGFASEFLIYSAMFLGMNNASLEMSFVLLIAETAMALAGGLSIFCFTKAFGVTFLGAPRTAAAAKTYEVPRLMLAPLALIAGLMILIGLLPAIFLTPIARVVAQFHIIDIQQHYLETMRIAADMSVMTAIVLAVVLAILLLRYAQQQRVEIRQGPTWGCGYTAISPKHQYTSTSYGDNFKQLAGAILNVKTEYEPIEETELFPRPRTFHAESADLVEEHLVMRVLRFLTRGLVKGTVLQTGQVQHYLLFPLFFLVVMLLLTMMDLL